MKNRAEAIPKQPGRTPGRPRKSIEIVCDRKIEGQSHIFDVNTTMLSQRSATFKQLFEVNMDESILIEGVPDRTLEMVIDFCHGKSLTECSNSDMSSLLFFAYTWDIVDLKKFIEEQMIQKMTPENVVIYANAAILSHSEIVGNACKGLILEKLQNHESIQNISKLDDRLRDEIIHLQYNQAS
uniref:BTB domain-containing protein n=1 Tax=Panagrolaimus davidi TaxID=227884 RepID=A0A914PUL0_9BILA